MAAGFAATLGMGLRTGLVTGLAALLVSTGFADFTTTLATGLAGFFSITLVAAFTGVLPEALATGLATAFGATLGAGFAAGLVTLLTAFAGIALPGFDFTSCLLAGLACACSCNTAPRLRALAGLSAGPSSARECTGSRLDKPISCKSETIIGLPNFVLFNV